MDTDTIRELLDYNPETGIFTWRTRGRAWFPSDRSWRWWNTRFAGMAAGSVAILSTGYPLLSISVLGKYYIASRLVFLWMGEPLPEQADHLDGDSLNQAWANLNPSTPAENMKNQSMRRTNTSGITGVCWHKAADKWRAGVKLGGKYHHLGLFAELDDAATAVATFYAANGFTDRHGQKLSAYQEKNDEQLRTLL